MILWNEDGEVLPDGFRARIAEQHFGAVVPTGDGSIERKGMNRIGSGFDDSR
jgi:hypothetical protein